MTDQKPDAGDNTVSNDNEATPPGQPEETEAETHGDAEAAEPEEAEAGEATEATEAGEAEADGSSLDEAAPDEAAADVVAETEAEAADAADAGAAWTTTPVAPDPEATEAALAALAAKPEVTIEPPETPPPPPPGDEEDEGTPVLLVGGILVGAFIVALAIVLILFRPFDNLSDSDASLSPSPVLTEQPSESPSAIATVDTPDFQGLPLEEAETTATDYGLVVRVEPVETDEVEPGMVMDQEPSPGEPVEEGSTIELAVAQPVPTASVPDVVGLDEEDATDMFEQAGFVLGNVAFEFDDDIAAGGVIRTDPPIDTELPQGTAIDLVISDGPELTPVPDLADQPEADALDLLDAAGLAAGARTEAFSDTVAAGNVVSSDPAADAEVAPGTEVAYVVSTGPELTPVPDLADQPEADALDLLDAAGLAAGARTEAFSDTVAAGNVVSSDPAADAEVAPGTEIDYTISIGPEQVEVPDLADQPEADALDLLDAAGLAAGARTEAFSDTVAAGNVVSQSPAAGAMADIGSAVAYVVSLGVETVAVPDLAGPAAAAPDAITTAGLTVGDATQDFSDTVAAGDVISQDPAAGTEVELGTAVDYVESLGVQQVEVPDLSGPASEADQRITDAGFVVGVTFEVNSDTIPAGEVNDQNPNAGEMAPLGSEIDYTISIGPEQVEVPDLADQPEADALDLLDAAGLAAGARTEAFSDTVAAGNVVSQSPAAGAMADIGSAVAYVVSLGVETVAVPDLAGPAAAAPDAITTAGLTVGDATQDFSDTVAAGDVISQDPAAGTEVELGTAVDYVESLGVQQVEVPDLSGPASEADQRITDAGFVVGVTFEVNSDTIPAGEVNDQNPNAGEMAPLGSEIDYTISIGPEQVEVPDLADQPEADALDLLDAAGLAAGARTEAFSDTVAAGNVVSQSPAAGAMADIGSAVAYVVSLGVETVAVPDLAGPAAAAPDAITTAGLTVGDATQDFSDTVVAGDVISQDPAAGTEVELGTAVDYVESLGVQQVEVPDLSGPASEADQRITDAGFVVGVTFEVNSDTIPAGEVNDQNPNAGEMAPLGSEIDYTISIGPEQVEVPDLADQPEADALDLLDAAGLAAGARTEAFSDTVAAGNVVSQSPAAGAMADIGSAVAYVVSLGVETVAVPDLAGPAAAAPDAITTAGLTVGDATQDFSDTVVAGDVISQDPAAGTEVELGTAVDYVESLGVQQVEVPDLSGPASEADQRITDAGFVVGVTFEVNSDTIPAGEVNDQNPNAGEMAPLGSEIDYTISIGPEQVEVPDLADQPEADALDLLDAAGLAAGARTEAFSDTVAAGNVVSQSPAAGAMADIGSAVAYVVSLGVETVAVPDLAGPAAAAPDAITTAGLTVGDATQDFSDTVVAGDVISQDPAAGTEVELGTAVDYVESLGVQQVEVPDLSGPASEADQRITDAGFVVGVTFEVNSDTIPAGEVNDQNPNAGEMAPLGSEIDYTISIGPEQVEVPDLADQPEADALDLLDAAGLAAGARTEAFSDTVAAGNVVSQSPAAGAMADIGSAVAYVVSLGVETVAVPDLAGPAAAAPDAITTAGLTVGDATQDFSDTVVAGDVISQDPAAGTEVELGTAVDYVESLGVQQVEVPDLSGPASEADQRITDAGFVVGVTFEVNSDTIPAGEVNDQNPNAGEMAPLGSEIDYTISIGPEQVEVPDLADQPEADALDLLDAAGLAAGARTEAFSDTVAAGNVVSQSPAAGAMADIGSAVAYVVSLGVETVAVPDLAGPAAAAPDAITTAGLTVGDATQDFSDTVVAGDVISQDPAAGTEVELGTAVDYVESLGVQRVEVPDLSGPASEADQRITDAGFVVGVTFEVNSDTIPAGEVNDQNPNAGEMAPLGSEIDYTISIGPEQVEVPDLADQPEADALDLLDAAGLAAGARTEAFSDTVAAGNVVSQSPAAGAMADIGSAVAYVVSLGVETVAVPDLAGPAAAAPDAITTAGLTVGDATQDFSDTVAAGDVISQDPAAGTEVELGTAVDYVESLGVQQVEVPVVRESSLEDATAAIEAAGLAADEVTERNHDSVPAGAAVGTDPAAGETVDIGSAVALYMSIGPEQVAVPDVVGMTEADAIAAIESAGLTVGEASTAFSDTVAAGNVVSQSPAAGAMADIGSAVAYVVSLGVETVAVPDLAGPAAAAPDAITTAGLTVGDATQDFSDTVAAGDVISQDPAAGTEVELGTAVDYVESLGVQQVEVPVVRESSLEDATAAIDAAGLAVGEVLERNHANVPAGAALRTAPAEGEMVDIGSSVSLFMSIGPEQVDVPDVVGMSEADAIAALQAASLVAGDSSDEYSDSISVGSVISTDPGAGTAVDADSAVDYVLSLGVEQVTVPEVIDMPEADAVSTIEAAGLTVGETTTAFDEVIAAGNVVSEDPAPGTEIDKGSAVDLVVSVGPTPLVVVPATRDLLEADAVSTIEEAALVVGETIYRTHENVAAGASIRTEPREGEEILQGESVNLYVSSGSAIRTVPDVSGQEAADAQAALETEDLTVVPDERNNANVPAGQAVKTEPAAGTEVNVGDDITLVVSRGPKQVDIPDVVGMARADARTAITDAELKVGDETVVEDGAAQGTVIAQDPVSGGQTDKNSAVNITVSSGPPQVVIPAVRGVEAGVAQATLEDLGLVVETKEVFHAKVAAGNAIKTAPEEGTPVDVGVNVTINVSKGPKPVSVPDVVGSKRGAATTAIEDAGLTVGEQTSVEDATDKNIVIAQDPVAGSEVPNGSAVALTVSSGPPMADIPDVRDVAAAEAQATLEDLGLVVETKEVFHARVAAGDAIKTNPAAGKTVAVGSTVTMNVSKGPKPVEVPEVTGLKKGAATTAIEDAGLTVGEQSAIEDAADRNTVLSQDPAAGSEVATGSVVNLTISSGPPSETIPDVRNVAAADAQATLENLGLVVETKEVFHAKVAAGDAIKTKPAAGETVNVGSTVTMNVSKGPKPVEVPEVTGLKKGAATSAIEDAGLTVGEQATVEDAADRNTVLSQDPPAGSEVATGSAVNLTLSSGPPQVTIPDVRDVAQARAVNDLENLGLVVETKEVFHAKVAAGDAIKTKPAAGETVNVGSTVTMNVSKGIKQVTVPDLVGLAAADVEATLTDAELNVGDRSEAENDAQFGTVIDQSPAAGSTVDKNSTVDYIVSSGPAIEQMGLGGDLGNPEVMSQLDTAASEIEPIRELELGNTPYDGSNSRQHELALAERIGILRDSGAIKAEERALKRLGLLDDGDDLAALLESLYGQPLPVAYFEDDGHLSVLEGIDRLDAGQQAQAAREFDRALTDQSFGLQSTRVGDKSRGDEALAGYALEQGDGTAAMIDWSAGNGNNNRTNEIIVPGDDGIYASMPLILQREYSLPFLEGRIFVDRLQGSGGWDAVNDAWGRPPESTEQILHPKLYPNERPTTVVMDNVAGRIGGGWSEDWQQTMGELRIGVWLANGAAGEQSGPKAAVKLPRANAAAGWGGDRLVSLSGPDGQWAIVWQTKWDSGQDVNQFVNAADRVLAGLGGTGLVATADVSNGVSNPAVVIIASSGDTLASVADALGVVVPTPA